MGCDVKIWVLDVCFCLQHFLSLLSIILLTMNNAKKQKERADMVLNIHDKYHMLCLLPDLQN